MATYYILLSILFLFSLSPSLIRSSERLECYNVNTDTHRIVDLQGRERYFHGVNVVVKGPPWIPRTDVFHPTWSFVEKDMEILRDLGMNAIRFGMMWPGAEPERDKYNETYFQIAKEIVDKAAKYGINVLLDMHQDVLSAKFCGEGIPDWAVDTGKSPGFPEPLSSAYQVNENTGYPSTSDCYKHAWSDYYTTEAVSTAFSNLYKNSSGTLDKLAAFWAKVASVFKDAPNILGYEIINEPWAGNIYEHPTLLWPGVADRENLAHVYDVVSSAIWKVDPCHNVYFEPVTWDQWTVGFKNVPGGKGNEHRSVLSYHFYEPPDVSPEVSFSFRMLDVKRLKCGSFLSEFSSYDSDKFQVLKVADDHLQSWTVWDYKPYYAITGDGPSIWNSNGTMNSEKASMLSRSYAKIVAGKTESINYDSDTHGFTLVYTTTQSCASNETEIYLNQPMHYSNGYKIAITPNSNKVLWQTTSKNHISVIHDSNLPVGTKIQVVVAPR